jgi:hypothetical protein
MGNGCLTRLEIEHGRQRVNMFCAAIILALRIKSRTCFYTAFGRDTRVDRPTRYLQSLFKMESYDETHTVALVHGLSNSHRWVSDSLTLSNSPLTDSLWVDECRASTVLMWILHIRQEISISSELFGCFDSGRFVASLRRVGYTTMHNCQ